MPQTTRMVVALLALLATSTVLTASSPAVAQSFPARPIRFLVGFAPGGSTDIFARLVGRSVEKSVGQPVVIENRPGAGGSIAANAVAKAEPDGYTYFFGSVTIIAPFFIKNGAVVGGKDLVPVSNVSVSPWAMFVKADLPVRTLPELIAYAKANPGKLNFGSPSSSNDLAMEVLKVKTGITYANIAYKGAGPVSTALLAGEIDMSLDSLPAYMPYLQAGKIRALFIAPARTAQMPSLPTAGEVGIPNFDVALPLTVWAPMGTPANVVQRMSNEVRTAVAGPEVIEQMRMAGAEPLGSTPDDLMKAYNAEIRFWSEAARLAKYEPQ